MENQHREIKGYRELNETESATMNEIKTKGSQLVKCLAIFKKVFYSLFNLKKGNINEKDFITGYGLNGIYCTCG